ncbi:MAG: hypothetical protein JWR54_3424 [Mucilaginibacter sp.]|nr:hypothetical protein [Mucilaginibacter sp.]
MQESQNSSNTNAGGANDLTSNPGNGYQAGTKNAHDGLLETIHKFYDNYGVMDPIETLSDLLQAFFNSNDPHDTDENNKPVPSFLAYSPDFVSNKVQMTLELIKFFVELDRANSRYRKYLGL